MDVPFVSIVRAEGSNQPAIFAAVKQAVVSSCDFGSLIRPGVAVLIKPNVFAPLPPPGVTDPRVVRAVVDLCREAGAGKIIVGEGRSISTAKYRACNNTTRECYEFTGMEKALAGSGAELMALEEDDFYEVSLSEGEILKSARTPRSVLEADVFINLPSMKIHSLTLVTLAIKNLHGIVCDEDKLFGHCYREARLAHKLVDIIGVRKPDLNIVSGLSGLEGDHTMQAGRPVEMGVIIAGRDIVAVDAVTSAAMGLDPMEVDTTRIAFERGMGEGRLEQIEIRGEPLEKVRKPFARPDIAITEEKFPGLRLLAGDYCRSCEYYICRGLEGLRDKGLLSAERPLTLIIGKNPPVPAKLEGKVMLAGDCCIESASVKSLRDRLLLEGRLAFIWACPPMEFRMRAGEVLG